MAKVVTSYSNFARAKVDHDMQGRFDLPIYTTGADEFTNFISNFKGNGIYRAGYEALIAFQDCAFMEFKFSNNQNYVLVLYANKMRFLSYDVNGDFGWVLASTGPDVILEVTTPWTLAQSKEIARNKKSYTQNFDTMIICHKDVEPQKLKRTAANAFTLGPYSRQFDPFPLTYAGTKAITGITNASNAVLTIVGHGYSVGDRFRILAVTGMTQINNYVVAVTVVGGVNSVTVDLDTSDTTAFTAYSANGTAEKVLTGDYPSVALFYKGRLDYASTRLKITKVFQSESAQYYVHDLQVGGTITDATALEYVIAELSQPIEWLAAGSNSLIAGAADGIVAINGGGVGNPITSDTVEANITPADGCNSAEPLLKDGFMFYVSENGRNLYYFNYDILTETFKAQDANFIAYDVSIGGGFSKIRYTKDRNNLIHALRGDGQLTSMNFNADEKIIGWHEHMTNGTVQDMAQISDNDGNAQLFTLVLRNSVYYIEHVSAYVEFKTRADFYSKANEADTGADTRDRQAYIRYVAEQLKACIFLDNATVFSDRRSATITYSSGAGTITAGSSSFVSGDVGKHIAYVTATGYESGRFLITGYTSATVVTVEVLQTPSANVYSDWYLSFDTLTGLSRFNSISTGVTADGGFIGDFTASGGSIDLGRQVTQAVVGYKYRGFIKTFPLGFALQGENTQATEKAISRVGIRCTNSVGGKFGTTPYRLEPVQELSQDDLNYLPPQPIDGTKYLSYSDDAEFDKCAYIVQDEPGPFQVCLMMIDTEYAVTRRAG